MSDFLLELRSEEIPARMQDKARDDLARLFTAELEKAGLKTDAIVTFATPRRLALIARDLPAETAAVSEEVKGPRVGAPPQALEGFLRKTGLSADQLVDRDGVLFAVIDKPGRRTADVLADAIPAIIRAFPWPKSMRWGEASHSTESLRWVRPLHGIVALLGEEIVPVEIAGVAGASPGKVGTGFPSGGATLKSSAATLGHRFHHPYQITIGSAADYAAKLHACHVIVDQDERRAIIALGATMAARKAGLELVQDEGLLTENAGLTEWPVPLLGRFDEEFLAVPPEVIQLTARVNQKYFVCRDAAGKLANAFVCTANIDAADGGAKIVEGNRKVLAARLSDARFFYETDLKVPLEEQAKKLEKIVFHEKLGTVADKVERVAKLARWLIEEGIVTSSSPRAGGGPEPSSAPPATLDPRLRGGTAVDRATLAAQADRAARLAKADLVTGMVGEFPELQGLMGGYYAAAQGEDPAVADAVRDHYKPVGQGDDVPTAPATVAVSLADKLDSLIGFFRIGLLPTGSRDPFALRRAAIAINAFQLNGSARFEASMVVDKVIELYRPQAFERAVNASPILAPLDIQRPIKKITVSQNRQDSGELVTTLKIADREYGPFATDAFEPLLEEIGTWGYFDSEFPEQIFSFFADRLKVQQREAGVRHDLIDAVFALGGEDDLVRLLARVHALQSFVGTEDGANLLAGYKRAANILKKEGVTGAAPKTLSYTPELAEADLIAALDAAEPAAASAVTGEDFEAAMAALATLRAPIDAFFDNVTVNDSDPDKRTARLALLARVRDAVHTVADFSKIEG